ncbi:hypothetical protein FOZ60_009637 [Perkinsus olseni]|uniref:ABC transporter domain-containing protein n=1 Tax=Perkinsus olseni TaxID=32597 RepID=A0A7J6PCI8_PEROL|nr:hypothetical protein FOZ60_009637 [Perkinsus olseni]
MNGIDAAELRGFATEADLRYAYEDARPASFFAAIVFDPIDLSSKASVQYKILINGTYAPNSDPDKQVVITDDTSQALILDYGKYIDTGFVALQNMIDSALVRVLTANSSNLTIPPLNAVQSFPRPTVQAAEAPWVFKWLPGWCVNISILFWFTAMVTKMVYDKEYEYYRYFLILKVSRWAYWSHWIAFLFRPVGRHIAWLLQSAGSVGLACTFIISAVYIALILGGLEHLSALKTALSMIPWFASMRGGEIMAGLDLRGRRACGILLFVIIATRLLRPSRSGAGRLTQASDAPLMTDDAVLEDSAMESPAIRLVGLTKRFRRQDKSILTAVNQLSLVVDRGEIFGLLGHNGAGKTTVIRMLCGEIQPDGGSVEFVTEDGVVDRDPALGVCLQQDILFPELTAKEHLQIFAGLRGSTIPQNAEIVCMMGQRRPRQCRDR